jgi:hypothetical protein
MIEIQKINRQNTFEWNDFGAYASYSESEDKFLQRVEKEVSTMFPPSSHKIISVVPMVDNNKDIYAVLITAISKEE